jgi:transposase
VQQTLNHDPYSGHLFAFRGKNASKLKILFWDGNGLCLFTKRLDHGEFIWPKFREVGATVNLTAAQLAMLIEGIDWRNPERTWKRDAVALKPLRNKVRMRLCSCLHLCKRLQSPMRLDLANLPTDPALLHPLPVHLPRDETVLDVKSLSCSGCGGDLHFIANTRDRDAPLDTRAAARAEGDPSQRRTGRYSRRIANPLVRPICRRSPTRFADLSLPK